MMASRSDAKVLVAYAAGSPTLCAVANLIERDTGTDVERSNT